jgi:SET domain-containing protein
MSDNLIRPSKCEIRMTLEKGWGVFAIDKIFEGEVIEDCNLLFIPQDSLDKNTQLFIDYRFNWPQGHTPVSQVLPLGYGCIYNHSDDNNAFWRDHPDIPKIFQFVAKRDIEPEEEICTYYGDMNYWSDGRQHTNVV